VHGMQDPRSEAPDPLIVTRASYVGTQWLACRDGSHDSRRLPLFCTVVRPIRPDLILRSPGRAVMACSWSLGFCTVATMTHSMTVSPSGCRVRNGEDERRW
jgi:hypothetical protein